MNSANTRRRDGQLPVRRAARRGWWVLAGVSAAMATLAVEGGSAAAKRAPAVAPAKAPANAPANAPAKAPAVAPAKAPANAPAIAPAEDVAQLRADRVAAPALPIGLLVKCRPESAKDLADAAELVKKSEFRAALIKYEALLKEDIDSVTPADGGRFLPVGDQVHKALSQLPPEGLAMYRLGVDDTANSDFVKGRDDGDMTALMRVVRTCRHATCGLDAVRLAADRSFDAGDFSRAARLYGLILDEYRTQIAAPDQALFLARLALSHGMVGRANTAAAVADKLRKEFADVTINAGGRRVNVTAFVDNTLTALAQLDKQPASGLPSPTELPGAGDRPMWSGDPAGTRLMGTANVLLSPRWRLRPAVAKANEKPSTIERLRQQLQQIAQQFGGSVANVESLQFEQPIPAYTDSTVFVRFPDRVVALDIYTGLRRWEEPTEKSDAAVAAAAPPNIGGRPIAIGGRRPAGMVSSDPILLDCGRSSVTVADGRVFTLEGVVANNPPNQFGIQLPPLQSAANLLVARRADTGKVLWKIGNGEPVPGVAAGREMTETEQMVASATWLTAPTAVDGRLYVVSNFGAGYHAVCLNAATGQPIWSRPIASCPQLNNPNFGASIPWLDSGTPPAVDGGTVYLLTNAGVLAALDQDDGSVQWLLQYNDPLKQQPGQNPRRGFAFNPLAGIGRPPSPLVIAGGKVIALPSDEDELLAVDASSGQIVWKKPREVSFDHNPGTPKSTLTYLAGVAGDRVILTGPDAVAYKLADGAMAWKSAISRRDDNDKTNRTVPLARPALSPTVLYLPWLAGQVARLDVRGGRVIDYLRPGGAAKPGDLPAGANLLTADGKMLAVTESDVWAFFSFDESIRRATQAINDSPNSPKGYLTRGQISFGSVGEDPKRIVAALEDLLKARDLASRGNPTEARSDREAADATLYALMAWQSDKAREGVATGLPGTPLEWLDKAATYATNAELRADLLYRRIEALEQAGDTVAAMDAAQALAMLPPETLVDSARWSARSQRGLSAVRDLQSVRKLGRELVWAMLGRHGRGIYDKHEKAAVARLTAASDASDIPGLEKLVEAYPYSSAAESALLKLGELYRQAARQTLTDARDPSNRSTSARLWSRGMRSLEKLALGREYQNSPLRVSAMVGCLALAEERKHRDARSWFARLSQQPPATLSAWPDSRDKPVSELLTAAGKRLYPRGVPTKLSVGGIVNDLPTPLAKLHSLGKVSVDANGNPITERPGEQPVYKWGGPGSRVLRDATGQPVTVDDAVVVLTPAGLCLVQPETNKLVWMSTVGRAPNSGNQLRFGMMTNTTGTLAGDAVVFWDGTKLGAIQVATGRLVAEPQEAGPGAWNPNDRRLVRRNQIVMTPLTVQPDGAAVWYGVPNNNPNGAQVVVRIVDPLADPTTTPGHTVTIDGNQLNGAYGGRPPAPAVAAGLVAVMTGQREFTVFDSGTGKKLFAGHFPGMAVNLQFTPAETVVATTYADGSGTGGAISYSTDGKKLWQYSATNANELTHLLYADGETVLLGVQRFQQFGTGDLVCLDAQTGKLRWKHQMSELTGEAVWRNAVHIEKSPTGDRLILLASGCFYQPQTPNQAQYHQNAMVLALEPETGKPIWKRPVDMGRFPNCPVSPPMLTPTQAVVFVRDQQSMTTRAQIFSLENGAEVGGRPQDVSGNYINNGRDQRWQMAYWSNWPVIVGETLLVETPDGIEIWGRAPGAKPKVGDGQ